MWLWKEKLFNRREVHFSLALFGAANFLAIWILSAEIISTVDSEYFDLSHGTADDVKSLSLSVLWAAYASVAIVLGIIKGSRWMRLAGITLLAVPVIKLFLFDIFVLELGYRVVAFMGLGGLLVAGGFLYQRHSRVIRGFLLG